MKIYLSGPIFLDDKEATEGWRNRVTSYFTRPRMDAGMQDCPPRFSGFTTLDPCRKKATYRNGFHTPNEILFRDLKDVDESDIILVNFNLKPDKISIGTICEIQHAWEQKKPVVIVSDDQRILEHPWILALTVKQFPSLEQAVEYIENFWG